MKAPPSTRRAAYAASEQGGVVYTVEAFPDLGFTTGEISAEDDLVIVRATAYGIHEQEFEGIESTDETFAIPGIMMHRVENRTIAESWVSRLNGTVVIPRFSSLTVTIFHGFPRVPG